MDLLECDLPGIKKLRSGKVREVFDLGENLLVVATDRISAFVAGVKSVAGRRAACSNPGGSSCPHTLPPSWYSFQPEPAR